MSWNITDGEGGKARLVENILDIIEEQLEERSIELQHPRLPRKHIAASRFIFFNNFYQLIGWKSLKALHEEY